MWEATEKLFILKRLVIHRHKNATVLDRIFQVRWYFAFYGLSKHLHYPYLSMSLIILLIFATKSVVAPCISMPTRPDDDATS